MSNVVRYFIETSLSKCW